MWLFTETGFVSVVQDRDDGNRMLVRARDKQSLRQIADWYGVDILDKVGRSDYPYRLFISRTQFVDWLVETGSAVDYDNYKNRVAQTRGYDFADPLHDVWATMLRLEKLPLDN